MSTMLMREHFGIEELTDAFRRLSLDEWSSPKINKPFSPLQSFSIPIVKASFPLVERGPQCTSDTGAKKNIHSPRPSAPMIKCVRAKEGPFSQMPNDVLYHLLFVLRTSDPEESLRTTVTISHVCAQWRAIATGAPLLWTYISLPWTRKHQHHFFTVIMLLRRSQHLPFTLHFVVDDLHGIEPFIPYWTKILSVHAQRIHTLIMTLNPRVKYGPAIRTISSMQLPCLTRFYLKASGSHRTVCTVSVKPRDQPGGSQWHLAQPGGSTTPYLDWTLRQFHITSLSLKYLLVDVRDLFPILVMSQSTLTHLEYYSSDCDPDWEYRPPLLVLSKLTSLYIGYTCVEPAFLLLTRLFLPSLSSALVRDFRRCPEPGLPTHVPPQITPDCTDGLDILRAMCPFSTITSLTLRGVECFTSSLEDVAEALQPLIEGLKSLRLVNCDGQFLHILRNITLESSREELEGLTDLAITCYDYTMVLDYLQLRAMRGLPRLRMLSVNAKMAILRHFVKEFTVKIDIRGVLKRKLQVDNTVSHPYRRGARPRRLNTIRGIYPRY